MSSTDLEFESKKIDLLLIEVNENYSKEVVRLIYDIVKIFSENNEKLSIIMTEEKKEFMKNLVFNYFLKMSLSESEDLNCGLICGKIYNLIIWQ
jgi:hypothetical protein